MSIIRWDPFGGADESFNRLLPSLFGRWPRMTWAGDGETKFEWSPSADISETDKEYRIRAELPAVKKDDVKVSVEGGAITIQGERRQQKEDKSEKYHRVETAYGSFTRSFVLPDDVNTDAIQCESKDGVLVVHLPKKEQIKAKPKQIKVD